MRLYNYITISIIILILTNVITQASYDYKLIEEDKKDDTIFIYQENNKILWKYSKNEIPYLDIDEFSYEIEQEYVTLCIKVNGSIKNSNNVIYSMYFISGNGSYNMVYQNEQGYVTKSTIEGKKLLTNEINLSDGNSICATFPAIGTDAKIITWVSAIEYTEFGNESKDWWGDWAPDEYFHLKNNTKSDDETRGFEIIGIIISIMILILFYKKRYN